MKGGAIFGNTVGHMGGGVTTIGADWDNGTYTLGGVPKTGGSFIVQDTGQGNSRTSGT